MAGMTYADRAAVLQEIEGLVQQLINVNNEAEVTKQTLMTSGQIEGGAAGVVDKMLASLGPVVMAYNAETQEFSCSDETVAGRIIRLLLPDAGLISWQYPVIV